MQCWPLVKFSQDKYCLGLVWISKTFSKFFIANQQWIHFANPVRNSITSKVSKIAPIHTVGPPRSDNIIEPARLAGGAEAPSLFAKWRLRFHKMLEAEPKSPGRVEI
ncbi:hypothetical protein TWF569_011808 [Orbilia oligospora]|uniref:Uncharacterized protein n=1 Tax=Orbilia oligospora TaxID=2813651 RepID=A0A7C8P6Z6_ORBOL|nr:hypothetical protein TWF103_011260 [Orbilia oligospora]KAF3098727.1 hypothetical protein TWF706_006737 [Orbilia oligospora]KAF3099468.1 hypothetical protein TWF102_005444 [Orbilia oligospora]KAF3127190.1 hypothetical protein TWF569_011808 [Orbilia oligospora]KAF3130018.1 hypothetical protein TWF594_010588 [Orbilia oligospora]